MTKLLYRRSRAHRVLSALMAFVFAFSLTGFSFAGPSPAVPQDPVATQAVAPESPPAAVPDAESVVVAPVTAQPEPAEASAPVPEASTPAEPPAPASEPAVGKAPAPTPVVEEPPAQAAVPQAAPESGADQPLDQNGSAGPKTTSLWCPPHQSGTVTGLKFNDLNRNGRQDRGECALSGWVFHLSGGSRGHEINREATSNLHGEFSFSNLPEGRYTLTEESRSGWKTSAHLPLCLDVRDGRTTSVAIGNYRCSVEKTFSLELTSGVQGADGYFVRYAADHHWHELALRSSGEGVYSAKVQVLTGTTIDSWQFFAERGHDEIALAASQGPETLHHDMINSLEFTPGTISGHKYLDTDMNAAFSEGDSPGPGWTIKLYQGDRIVATTVTGEGGAYSFGGLLPGCYRVAETPQSDYTQIVPAGGSLGSFRISSGSSVSQGTDFLNQPKTASILVTKTGAAMAHVGDSIDYAITVKNTGQLTLTNVTVTDPLFGDAPLMTGVTLLPGERLPVATPAYLVPDVTAVNNTVSAVGTSVFGTVASDASWSVDVLRPAILVTKSVSSDTVVDSDVVTYTATVTNTGDATLMVSVKDWIGGAVHAVLDSDLMLAPGAHKEYTWTETVSAPVSDEVVAIGVDALGGEVGTVTSTAGAHVGVNLTKTFELTLAAPVPAAADYFVRYAVGEASTDLALVGDGAVRSAAVRLAYGSTISSWQFFARLANGGVVAISPVFGAETLLRPMTNGYRYAAGTVSGTKFIDVDRVAQTTEDDTRGAGWTINLLRDGAPYATTVTLADGTYSFTGLLPGSYTLSEQNRTNFTLVSGPAGFIVPVTQAGESEVPAFVLSGQDFVNQPSAVSISVVKSADAEALPLPGGTVNYTYVVTNPSDFPLFDVELVDDMVTVPGSAIGTLAPGASRTLTASANITEDTVNVATVTGHDEWGAAVEATSSWTVNLFAPFTAPDVKVVKSADVRSAIPGDVITYTLTYQNIGEGTASGVTLVDDYPQAYVDVVDAGGGTVSGGRITWEFPDSLFASDGPQTVTYTVKVKANLPAGTTVLRNTVVIATPDDTDPSNNTSSWNVTTETFLPFTETEPFLPFTGGDWTLLGLAAALALGAGLGLRRLGRPTP